jgi:tetratricopeptide (TPR) repeat protein
MLKNAESLEQESKFEAASLEYAKAIQKFPKNGDVHYLFAQFQLRRQDGTGAFQSFQRAADLKSDPPEIISNIVDLGLSAYQRSPLLNEGFYRIARRYLDRLVLKDPFGSLSLRLQAEFALVDKKPEEAVPLLEKSRSLNQRDSLVTPLLAIAYFQAGQGDKARPLAEGLIARGQANFAVYDALQSYLAELPDPPAVEALLRKRVQAFPNDANSVMRLSQFLAGSGRLADVAPLLEGYAQRFYKAPASVCRLAEFWLNRGDTAAALQFLAAATKLSGGASLPYQIRSAQILASNGRVPEAQALLKQARAAHPQDTLVQLEILKTDLAAGNTAALAEKIATAKAIAAAEPANADAHFTLSRLLAASGDAGASINAMQAAHRADPDSLPIRLAYLDLLLLAGRNSDASILAANTVRFFPESNRARLALASTHSTAGRFAEAQQILNELEQSAPNDIEVVIQKGFLALRRQRFAEAETAFAAALRSPAESNRAKAGLAQTYLASNQPSLARQILTPAPGENAQPAVLRAIRAEAARREGDFLPAIALHREFLAASPDSAEVQIALANLLRESGQFAEALDLYRKVATKFPTHKAPLLGQALVAEAQGAPDKAEEFYRATLRHHPSDDLAANNLAYLLANSGKNLPEALTLAERVHARTPQDRGIQDTLAWVLAKSGDTSRAIFLLQGLLPALPDSSTVHYHLGFAYHRAGNKAQAKRYLDLALAKRPPDGERAQIEALLKSL